MSTNLFCTTFSDNDWESICGPALTREEVFTRLKSSPELYQQYLNLSNDFQEEFVAFSMGTRGAKITYDPFFKHIFNPYLHPQWLESFLSACFNERTEIVEILPNESMRLTEDSSFLIADLLVKLQSGALVNVEIQRIGYYFPGARCACYSSDLIMRQYVHLRESCRRENKYFSYRDIRKVYTIVIMKESTPEFHKFPEEHIHYAKQTFQSGLNMDLLQEYLLIPLDIFLKNVHNTISILDAWLYFIASDKIEDIQRVCTVYPEFKELYREVFRFRYQPKELISMFSEALRILDQNTARYMIDDMKRQSEELAKQISEYKQKLTESQRQLTESQQQLTESQQQLTESQQQLTESQQQLTESQQQLTEKDTIIAMLNEQIKTLTANIE